MLREKVSRALPESFTFETAGYKDIPNCEYDIILTFTPMLDAVKSMAPDGAVIRTIESFNSIIQDKLADYITKGEI